MAKQTIGIGTVSNDGTGDPARTAFGKVNDNFDELYGQLGQGIATSTVTTKQNDYAPTGWTTCRTLRWNGAGSTGITGFDATGLADGAERTIVNASTDYLLWMENQNTASAAANRMMLPKGFPAFLMPGDLITLQYDATATKWRVLGWPSQGPAMGFTEFTDWLGYYTASACGPFGGSASGTASSIEPGTLAGQVQGAVRLRTGTTTTGYSMIGLYQNSIDPGNGAAFAGGQFSLNAAVTGSETYDAIIGFGESAAANDNAVCWEYRWNGSAAEISQTLVVAGTPARTTTGSPSASEILTATSNGLWLFVFVNPDWSAADFIYSTDGTNMVLASRVSGGLPTSSLGVGFRVLKSAGSANISLYSDFYGVRVDSEART